MSRIRTVQKIAVGAGADVQQAYHSRNGMKLQVAFEMKLQVAFEKPLEKRQRVCYNFKRAKLGRQGAVMLNDLGSQCI